MLSNYISNILIHPSAIMALKMNESDNGRKGVKRKHVTLTVRKKLEVLKMLERGINRSAIMNEFNIGSSTIYDIKKNEDKLRAFLAESEASTKHSEVRRTLRKPKMVQLDAALFKWFSENRSEGKTITELMLIEKAKEFHSEMNITEACNFSKGWLRGFKYRHGINIRKVNTDNEQKSIDRPIDHIAAEEYSSIFGRLAEEHGLSPSQIYNADETALLWHCLPNSILIDADYGFKMNKDRITVLLCANASGTHKLKLLIIGTYKKPRSFINLASLPIIYKAQSNALMTADIFKDWFFNNFVPAVNENFRKEGLPENSKAVLLLGNYRAHPPTSDLVCGNIFATYLPANVASLIHPMGQGVIQNFKSFYRECFLRKMINSNCGAIKFQSEFQLKDAVYTSALAWKDIKKDTLQKCWWKLWPNLMFCEDSSDDEDFTGFKLRPKHIDNIQKIIINVPENNPIAKLSENEIEEWLDIDKNEPVIDILNDVTPQTSEDTEEEEEAKDKPKYTWEEATEFITKFVRFAEGSSQYNASEVMNLHILLNNFYIKKSQFSKQTDLRDMFIRAQKMVTQ